jgi:hypothetical protein
VFSFSNSRTDLVNMLTTILSILFLAISTILWYKRKKIFFQYPDNFPPGPRFPLPIAGDGYAFKNIPEGFESLHKKYGKIVGLNLGGVPTVSIADYDLIQEAFDKDDFSGRPNASGLMYSRGAYSGIEGRDALGGNYPGIVFSEGSNWTEKRRFSLRYTKIFRSNL